MTISLETLGVIITFLAVVAPATFYMGRLSKRVETVEDSQKCLFEKMDELTKALNEAVVSGAASVLHCPLADDEKCAFRRRQQKER